LRKQLHTNLNLPGEMEDMGFFDLVNGVELVEETSCHG
jgi:hypothetical protein